MALYNARKRQILEFIYENDFVTSAQVSNELSLEIHNSRTLLKKYYKQGLLTRKNDGIRKIYTISERGIDRLDWLEKTMWGKKRGNLKT